MTDREILDIYTNLVPFLSRVLGAGCEIVIHDISNPEHSIIAIGNGVSGRTVGDPMTDLAREMQRQYAQGSGAESVLDYKGRTKSGDFLSSTYFIRNGERLIGLMCVNKELACAQELNHALHSLLERFNLTAPPEDALSEDLSSPFSDIVHSRIADIIGRESISPAHMTRQEKIRVVHRMDEDGVLMMKGAVAEAARQLSVSVPTIYRYLNQSIR